jgi:hypothetical protein
MNFSLIASIVALVISIIVPLITFYSKTYISGFLSNKFNIALEEYRQKLSQIGEEKKYELEKYLSNFNQYSQKKHEIYSELYKKLKIADGMIRSLVGFKREPSFEEYNKKDMEKYLIKKGVLESYARKLLVKFDTEKDSCIKDIRNYLALIEYNEAIKKYEEAKNYFLIQELYLSDELAGNVLSLIKSLGSLSIDYDPQFSELRRSEDKRKEINEEEKKCLASLEIIKNTMKKELSIGYYKENIPS